MWGITPVGTAASLSCSPRLFLHRRLAHGEGDQGRQNQNAPVEAGAWRRAPCTPAQSFFNRLSGAIFPPRKHTANSTARVGYVANVPRDQVHVDMHA